MYIQVKHEEVYVSLASSLFPSIIFPLLPAISFSPIGLIYWTFHLTRSCFSRFSNCMLLYFLLSLALLCRSGGLPQPPEWRVLPGSGVSREMSLRGHRGRLLQSQTDPCTSTRPWTHHGPVSHAVFPPFFTCTRIWQDMMKYQIESHVLNCSKVKL